MKKTLILTTGILCAAPVVSPAALINRYSFNAIAAGAPAGTTITDSVGGANGVIVGDGANFTGGAINLPGGAGTSTAAYVDLPNGLLSSHNTVTFEAWFTVESTTNAWGRVWDFGSSLGGEVVGSGGGGEGWDYFMYAPMQGTDINLQRNALRNLDPATLGSGVAPVNAAEIDNDPNLTSLLGTQYHIATVWEDDGAGGGIFSTYRDGVLVGRADRIQLQRDGHERRQQLARSLQLDQRRLLRWGHRRVPHLE